MISSRTMVPVDDARLATGENSERARIMLNFSTMEVVSIAENGGLVLHSSYHWKEEVEGVFGMRVCGWRVCIGIISVQAEVESRQIINKGRRERKGLSGVFWLGVVRCFFCFFCFWW
jgi:hypothetical protein